ncbi:MAG: hypothetical protein U0930_22160 [Pirellulales bacterium]
MACLGIELWKDSVGLPYLSGVVIRQLPRFAAALSFAIALPIMRLERFGTAFFTGFFGMPYVIFFFYGLDIFVYGWPTASMIVLQDSLPSVFGVWVVVTIQRIRDYRMTIVDIFSFVTLSAIMTFLFRLETHPIATLILALSLFLGSIFLQLVAQNRRSDKAIGA